jgi:hypothetical protein
MISGLVALHRFSTGRFIKLGHVSAPPSFRFATFRNKKLFWIFYNNEEISNNLGKALNFSFTVSLVAIFGLFPLPIVQAQRRRYEGW